VMGSRGSVIPLFVAQALANQPLTITDPAMTRFMMTLEQAVELVLFAFEHGDNGDIFVLKAPAATVATVARAVLDILGRPNHPIEEMGTRHGEKLYETLLSREECATADDMGEYFRIPPDSRDLNYSKYVERGELRLNALQDYNSHGTTRLDLAQTRNLLLKLEAMQAVARGEPPEFES
jgi:UDP-N-acetylglucosamine 4,6-dehydratase/5-epimerase